MHTSQYERCAHRFTYIGMPFEIIRTNTRQFGNKRMEKNKSNDFLNLKWAANFSAKKVESIVHCIIIEFIKIVFNRHALANKME